MTTVGTGDLIYEPVENWHQLPDDITLTEAVGVATDSRDNVYVFNRGEPPIVIFNRDGDFLRCWGEGQFVRPPNAPERVDRRLANSTLAARGEVEVVGQRS